MKRLIFYCISLLLMSNLYAQSYVQGYYISQTNDTINTQIKIPKSIFGQAVLSELIDKVVINDSIKGEQKFSPNDIKSFGFLYNGFMYHLYSKPIHKNGLRKFLQPTIIGNTSSLFQYTTANIGGNNDVLYIFEKSGENFAFIHLSATLSKFRETLMEFYKDNLPVQQLIATKFQRRINMQQDVKDILKAVNN